MFKNILIVLCIVLIIYYASLQEHENFDSKQIDPKTKGDTLTVNMLDDPLFADVVVYNNDSAPYLPNQKIGLEKCVYACNGNCVEFGITGTAFCFPKKE